jgi:hypothetical protein
MSKLVDEEHCIERLLFGYFFLAVEEKVTGSKGFESKTGKEASKRSACLVHKVHTFKAQTQHKPPNKIPHSL